LWSPENLLFLAGLKDPSNLALPEVLVIGAQKAGTTWLYENFKPHPELYVPEQVKELHYFDFLFYNSLRKYAEVFEEGRDRIKCDVTPSYARLRRTRIRFIRRVMPDARLIFIMRNPIERTWSQALMDLVRRSYREYEDVAPREFYAYFHTAQIQKISKYSLLLDRWLSIFPREQLFVGFFEDLVERPEELLRAVFLHIGVTGDVDFSLFPCRQKIHEGIGIPLPDEYLTCLQEIYRTEIETLAKRFGGAALNWLGGIPARS
jgi:hypothetical protein